MASRSSMPGWLPALGLAAPVLRPLYDQLAPLELLARAAYLDSLTGLANKAALAALVELLDQGEEVQAAIAIDLKGFKAINDQHGHDAGDAALSAAAEVVSQVVAKVAGIAARPSGDEFCAIVPVDKARVCADELAQKLVAHNFQWANQQLCVAGVVGFALPLADGEISADSESLEKRMKRADLACNEAKHRTPGVAVEHTAEFVDSEKTTKRFRCAGCTARVDVEVPSLNLNQTAEWKCPNCSGVLLNRESE